MTTARHSTSVDEMREWGIWVKPTGRHRIRVLGALRHVPLPDRPPSKEEVPARGAVGSWESKLASGQAQGPQQDPQAQPYHPRLPSGFVTRQGDLVFLERDWT
jgi:hypothetical protein